MRRLYGLKRWGLTACATLAALMALGAGVSSDGRDSLRQRCQEVRVQLAVEKARVMREDAEAIALRERIETLYRELDRLVASKPEVARLQADLKRLEEAAGPPQTPAAATPKGAGAKP